MGTAIVHDASWRAAISFDRGYMEHRGYGIVAIAQSEWPLEAMISGCQHRRCWCYGHASYEQPCRRIGKCCEAVAYGKRSILISLALPKQEAHHIHKSQCDRAAVDSIDHGLPAPRIHRLALLLIYEGL